MIEFSDFLDFDKEKFDKKKEELGSKVSLKEPEAIYNETFGFVRQLYERLSQEKELDLQGVRSFTERLANNVALTEDKLVFLTTNIYTKDYLLYHTVNVTILAIKIGMYLQYAYELIVDLGVFALLHGLDTPQEEGETAQTLEEHRFIQQFIQARQIQEYFIQEALSIIALLDVYESLTHNRPYRLGFMPYEVLKAIISAAEDVFEPKMVKVIINVFTIYPLGSTVRLNSGEIAQVIRINHEFPLRPEVLILKDSEEKEIKEKKTINLAARHNLFIKEVI